MYVIQKTLTTKKTLYGSGPRGPRPIVEISTKGRNEVPLSILYCLSMSSIEMKREEVEEWSLMTTSALIVAFVIGPIQGYIILVSVLLSYLSFTLSYLMKWPRGNFKFTKTPLPHNIHLHLHVLTSIHPSIYKHHIYIEIYTHNHNSSGTCMSTYRYSHTNILEHRNLYTQLER